MLKIFKQIDWWMVVAFFLPLVVYILTLAPTVYTEDSAEFVTAAVTLGIGHAPGYPLYAILAKLFTYLPFGELSWRVNLLSAVAGALAVAVLYLIIKKLISHDIIALASSLVLAFSAIFWSQSLIAEVYTLNAFFSLLTLYWLLLWRETKKISYLYAISFLIGLAAGNHQLILMLVPVYFSYIYVDRSDNINKRTFFLLLGLLVTGLGIYLYLPIRSLMNQILDMGHPSTLLAWFNHVARLYYNDWGLLSASGNKWALVFSFGQNILEQFGWLAVLIGLAGLVFYKNRSLTWLLVGVFVFQSMSIIMLRNLGWSEILAYIYRVYYLVAYALVAIFIAWGIKWLWQILQTKIKFFSGRGVIIGVIILLLWPAFYLQSNWTANDLSQKTLVADYFLQLLRELPPRAILVVKHDGLVGDTEIFNLGYWRLVEGIRPDVTIISSSAVFKLPSGFPPLDKAYSTDDYLQKRSLLLDYALVYAQKERRPLLATYAISGELPSGTKIYSRLAGYSYAIFTDQAEALAYRSNNITCAKIVLTPPAVLSETYFQSYLYYWWAAGCLEKGEMKVQRELLLKAIDYDDRPFSYLYNDYIKYRQWLLDNSTK